MPNIINNVLIVPAQVKKEISILKDEFCEELAFPYLLSKGKVFCDAPRYILISSAWYFHQWLPNFNQYFLSDADHIFFVRSVYE